MIGALLAAQTILLLRFSVIPLAERAWQVRSSPALERSAEIAFGSDFAEFMDFIRETVPADAKLVVPSKSLDPVYGDIGLMQYFLRPRRVIDCPAGEDMLPCLQALTGASTFILAVPDFPPRSEASEGRVYVEHAGRFGAYSPRPASEESPAEQDPPDSGRRSWIYALLLDALAVGFLVAIGALAASALHRDVGLDLVLVCSLPVGMASLTWVLFLLSWLNVRLTIWTLLFTGGALLGLMGLLLWRRRTGLAAASGRNDWHQRRGLPSLRLGWAACIVVVAASLILSVARSYSTWDDMAAYSIQGYGIAREGSVEAAWTWGPSAASYPLNVPIAISIFHLIDGDIVPGSKLLFPLLLGSLLLGAYRAMRSAGHTDRAATVIALGIGTVPVVFDHSTTGYTNLPFTIYLFLGSWLALVAFREQARGLMWLAGVMLAGALWTRPEGLLLVWGLTPILLVAGMRIARRRDLPVGLILPPAAVTVLWLTYAASHGGGGSMTGSVAAALRSLQAGTLHLDGIYWTLRYLARSLIEPSVWGLLLPMAVLLGAFGLQSLRSSAAGVSVGMLEAALAVGVMMFGFYYLVSFSGDVRFWLGTGVERMFLPAGVLAWMGLGGLVSARADRAAGP
jgi:hypothetical protein